MSPVLGPHHLHDGDVHGRYSYFSTNVRWRRDVPAGDDSQVRPIRVQGNGLRNDLHGAHGLRHYQLLRHERLQGEDAERHGVLLGCAVHVGVLHGRILLRGVRVFALRDVRQRNERRAAGNLPGGAVSRLPVQLWDLPVLTRIFSHGALVGILAVTACVGGGKAGRIVDDGGSTVVGPEVRADDLKTETKTQFDAGKLDGKKDVIGPDDRAKYDGGSCPEKKCWAPQGCVNQDMFCSKDMDAVCMNISRPGASVTVACLYTSCLLLAPRGTPCALSQPVTAGYAFASTGVCGGAMNGANECVSCGFPNSPFKTCPY